MSSELRAKKVLFVTSAHPGGSGFIGAGEGVCAASLVRWIESGAQVHVLCLASPHQHANPQLVAQCASYRSVVQRPQDTLVGIFRSARHGSWLAPWFFTRCAKRNVEAVKQTIQAVQPDRIWLDFAPSLGLACWLTQAESDYFVHDVVSQNVGRRSLLAWLTPFVTTVERRLLARVQRCFTLSHKDERLIRELGFLGSVVVWPPKNPEIGQVLGLPVTAILKQFTGQRNLVFFGNMQRPENHWSLVYFLLFQFSAIRRHAPDVHLWILGLSPRLSLRAMSHLMSGVTVTGAIDDPRPAFAAATLGIAPLRLGAGVKIKVLQMLQSGMKVVSTSIGAEGLNQDPNLIIADDLDFVAQVCHLLDLAPPQVQSFPVRAKV